MRTTLMLGLLLLVLPTGSSQELPLPSELDGCDEFDGAGVGSITFGDDPNDAGSAEGGWHNGCGGRDHDDSAGGSWISGTDAGSWSIAEARDTDERRLTSCSLVGQGFELTYETGSVDVNAQAANGQCGGGMDGDVVPVYSFDLHDPAVELACESLEFEESNILCE